MFCTNCGAKVEETQGFCHNCGSKLEAPVQAANTPQAPVEPQFTAPVEPVNEVPVEPVNEVPTEPQVNYAQAPEVQPQYAQAPEAAPVNTENLYMPNFQNEEMPQPKPKKKKTWLIWLLGIIGVLIIAGVAAFFLFRDQIEGLIAKNSSPEDYQLYVYDNLSQKLTDGYSEYYALMTKEETGNSGAMTFEVGTAAKEIFESAGMDVSDLETLTVSYDINSKGNTIGVDLGLHVNNESILTGEAVFDKQEGILTVSLPELSDEALKVDMSDYYEPSMFTAYAQLLPESDVFELLVERYLEAALGAISGVEKTDDTLTINGVSEDATLLTTRFSEKVVADMVIAVLTEAKDDKDLKDVIYDFINEGNSIYGDEVDPDEMYSEMIDGINDILDEAQTEEFSEEAIVTLNTWVNSSDEIIAVKVEADYYEIFAGCATDGDAKEFALTVSEDGDEYISITASGNEKGGVYNGDISFEVEDELMFSIEASDVDTDSEKFIGKLSFSSPMFSEYSTVLGMFSITLEGQEDAIILGVSAGSGQIASLVLTYEEHTPESKDLHHNTVDDPEAWAEGFDVEAYSEKLENGVLGEIFGALMEAYGANSYYYGGNYDEDYAEDEDYLSGYYDGYTDGSYDAIDGDYLYSYGDSAQSYSGSYTSGYDDGYEDGYDAGY